jgi:hypothetical protein
MAAPRGRPDLGRSASRAATGHADRNLAGGEEFNEVFLSRARTERSLVVGGAQQIHLNIVAERLLGLPRDPR